MPVRQESVNPDYAPNFLQDIIFVVDLSGRVDSIDDITIIDEMVQEILEKS